MQSSNNSINNNYNNNNDFGNNSTLIEFDGMNGEGGLGGGQESNNLLGDSNTGLLSNSTTTSNPLINNPLQGKYTFTKNLVNMKLFSSLIQISSLFFRRPAFVITLSILLSKKI